MKNTLTFVRIIGNGKVVDTLLKTSGNNRPDYYRLSMIERFHG